MNKKLLMVLALGVMAQANLQAIPRNWDGNPLYAAGGLSRPHFMEEYNEYLKELETKSPEEQIASLKNANINLILTLTPTPPETESYVEQGALETNVENGGNNE